jgi:hypothetical protein
MMTIKHRSGTLILSLFSWLMFVSAAFCSDITGVVTDNQGKPVPGAQITVANSQGQVVGSATTNKTGQYCINGIQPGLYKDSVTPPAQTGLKAGTVKASLSTEGLTNNWSVSPITIAMSSANKPGACDPPAFTDKDILIGLTAYAALTGLGLGVACAAGDLNCGDEEEEHHIPPVSALF